MTSDKFSLLINKISHKISSLICLEDENANLLPSNGEIREFNGQKIEYQNDHSYLMFDPRINFLKQLLKIILAQGPLTYNKRLLRPFSFRLKHLKYWLILTGATNFLSQMAWACKADCIFCFQKGSPPFMRYKKRISKDEIYTRLKYFSLKRERGLVAGEISENDEVLNNPYITKILKVIRKKEKKKMLEITTNGTPLTPKMVKQLAKFNPILLIISLNSTNHKIRKCLMKDYGTDIAIASLPLLKKHKITFIVSIVAWPGLPFSDIEKTIHYAEKNNAYKVRLILPGYSKFFSKTKPFDSAAYWPKIIKYFKPKLKKYSVPISITRPDLFAQDDLPRVEGTVINSPAYNSGVKSGDLIMEINGQPINSSEEAVDDLTANLNNKVRLKIKRGNSTFELEIKDKLRGCYPYVVEELRLGAPFGFVLAYRYILFDDDAKDILRYGILHQAKNIMILASSGIRPSLERKLKQHNIAKISGAKIHIVTPKNYYFGGNINVGDLLVVEDFIKAIKRNLKRKKVDLIILPASPFTKWGRDLTGRINLAIEREIGIPVEFIYTSNKDFYT